MKGYPKYKVGDKVKFEFKKNDIREGIIEIVDKYGTFDYPNDVSYDIMILDYIHPDDKTQTPEWCLCKHNPENSIIEFISENNKSLLN
jgi:hypothetical protein